VPSSNLGQVRVGFPARASNFSQVAQGKQNLGAACPKGTLEYKLFIYFFFSSPGVVP